jgi:hypothetical protein
MGTRMRKTELFQGFESNEVIFWNRTEVAKRENKSEISICE